jgi:hypothetical protein
MKIEANNLDGLLLKLKKWLKIKIDKNKFLNF